MDESRKNSTKKGKIQLLAIFRDTAGAEK